MAERVVVCNGASPPPVDCLVLDHSREGATVRLDLERFAASVSGRLPDRVVDLLEICAYVFCADRLTPRGRPSSLVHQSWPRSFEFHVAVRDAAFWSSDQVQRSLIEALRFMTGDAGYEFTFVALPPTGVLAIPFEHEEGEHKIVLFSGGIDSLAGLSTCFNEPSSIVHLATHRTGQPGTHRVQDDLLVRLRGRSPCRTEFHPLECHLRGATSAEESQRTRAFLYYSMGFAVAQAYGVDTLHVFENGTTGTNLPKREDMRNARASRTAHPRTVRLTERLLSLVGERPFHIQTPFLWHTKSDVLQVLRHNGLIDLLAMTQSCSQTFQNVGLATHCGLCSQCVDRRIAEYATGVEEYDPLTNYSVDFIREQIPDGVPRTTVIDYVRQAKRFAETSADSFTEDHSIDLVDLADGLPEMTDIQVSAQSWDLHRRHGRQVLSGLARIHSLGSIYDPVRAGTILQVIHDREYLKEPERRLAERIASLLSTALPITFDSQGPKDEADLNDKIAGLLSVHSDDWAREYPAIRFALGTAVPDHSAYSLLVEGKFIRGATSPGKVNEGMAADLTKYGKDSFVLFIVYDPGRSVVRDKEFAREFEARGRCLVCIIR